MIFSMILAAQAADGVVREHGTGNPVEAATIQANNGQSCSTDAKGHFSLDVPAGGTIEVFAAGFAPQTVTIPADGQVVIWLKPGAADYEIVVESDRDDPVVSEQRLDRERVLQTPGTFEDPVRLVGSLPGVTVTPEFSKTAGDIAVRGAAPGENRFYLDGIEIPYLYHYNQYASVFHTRLLDELTLYPSTFGASYGDVTGAIVDTRSSWEQPARLRGSANLNLIMSGAEIATPIGEKGSVRASARRSYVDFFSDDPWYTDFPAFYDWFTRIQYNPSENAKWGILGFGAGDSYSRLALDPSTLDPVAQTQDPTFAWDHHFQIAALQHQHRFAQLALDGSLSFTLHHRSGQLATTEERIDDRVLALREDALWVAKDSLSLAAGLELYAESLNVFANPDGLTPGLEEETVYLARGIQVDQQLARLRGGIYTEARWNLGNVRVVPGLRLDADSLTTGFHPDPRINLRWDALESTRLRLAAGRYSSFPRSEFLVDALGGSDLSDTTSWQTAAGLDEVIAKRWEFSLDGYYKTLQGLTDINSEGVLVGDLSGTAIGGELTSHYRLRELFFASLSASLSHAERAGAPYDYDQPYAFNVAFSWNFAPNWNVGLRYRYATGLPYTPAIDGTYQATTDSYTPIFGETNSARLPDYQKIDLHLEKRFNARTWNLTTYMEAWYVPKDNNVMYVVYRYDYDQTAPVHGPGFVPLVGMRGEF